MAGRIIFLVDLDSFYASMEERRHPELKGKPIAVCMFSGRTKDSGAIATANYKARELGIHSGMYIPQARRLVEKAKKEGKEGADAVEFLPADRQYYKKVSDRVMSILRKQADAFQQVSIDEAYMDVSERTKGSYRAAEKLAAEVKKKIREKEGLTCSIGIGPNKVVAKMAASAKKPDGLTIVRPERVKGFLTPLLLRKLHGIGPKTAEALEGLGMKTIGDLAAYDLKKLKSMFGERRAEIFWKRARGEDDEPVEQEERKQLGRIATLKRDSRDPSYISRYMPDMIDDILEKLSTSGFLFRTVSIGVVTTGMDMKTRSLTLDEPASDRMTIKETAMKLLKQYLKENPKDVIRRFGIRVSNFEKKGGKDKKANTLARFVFKS